MENGVTIERKSAWEILKRFRIRVRYNLYDLEFKRNDMNLVPTPAVFGEAFFLTKNITDCPSIVFIQHKVYSAIC